MLSLDGTTWAATGLIAGDSTVTPSPTGNARFGYVSTAGGVSGVVNWGDEVFDSALAFDFSGLDQARFPDAATPPSSTVPAPASSALALLGLGLMGGLRRKRG